MSAHPQLRPVPVDLHPRHRQAGFPSSVDRVLGALKHGHQAIAQTLDDLTPVRADRGTDREIDLA